VLKLEVTAMKISIVIFQCFKIFVSIIVLECYDYSSGETIGASKNLTVANQQWLTNAKQKEAADSGQAEDDLEPKENPVADKEEEKEKGKEPDLNLIKAFRNIRSINSVQGTSTPPVTTTQGTTTPPATTTTTQGTSTPPVTATKGQAGEEHVKDRIVGGDVVKPNSIPWQVAIFVGDSLDSIHCGGTILCPNFIMTAGHCFNLKDHGIEYPPPADLFTIGAGEHDLSSKGATASVHKSKAFHRHPDFKNFGTHQDKDFAIMELSEPIVMRKEAKALFLPSPTDTNFGADTKFLVSGWGTMKAGLDNGQTSQLLNSVTLPWISEDDCNKAYKDPKDYYGQKIQFSVADDNICAGVLGKGKIDACSGDSGGPLAWIDTKAEEVKLIGVVSWGFGCAKSDSPGVFGRVTSVLDWIKETIGKCNEETCSAGNCMSKDSLDRNTKKAFKEITKSRI